MSTQTAHGAGVKALEEFRSYAEFGADDEALLRAMWPLVEPHTGAIVDTFYDRVLDHPSTREIISDPAQVERLKRTLEVWLRELLLGPWDAEYAQRRRRIGLVHVEVGVNILVMSMAMSGVQQHLVSLVARSMDDPTAATEAIRKVTMLDLALMTNAYQTSHEEQRLRDARVLLVANLPATAFLLSADGLVQSVTEGAAWLCDASAIEPSARHFRDVLPSAIVEGANLEKYIERAMRTGNDVRLPRVDVVIDNETHHISVIIVPYEDPEPGVLLYIENHTVAVESERRVQQAEHLASIGTLSATIAHELRNPLAGISGALQVIVAGFDPADRRRVIIQKILEQVRALNWMVSDLLAFARSDKLQTQDGIDLAALCHTVIENVREDFPNVAYEVHGEASVAADPNMLRQILLNLSLNAAQALGGDGRIAFQVTTDEIVVCDSGPGLPEHIRRRAFEPFFTTKLKGTGLGLPISLKLARAMGGDLRPVDDSPLGGACFSLVLRRGGK